MRLQWAKQNISLICTELERIRGEKLIFKKFGPFSALSVQNRPKFCCSFVHPLYRNFYLALFELSATLGTPNFNQDRTAFAYFLSSFHGLNLGNFTHQPLELFLAQIIHNMRGNSLAILCLFCNNTCQSQLFLALLTSEEKEGLTKLQR